MENFLICIVGPTCTGKTGFAVNLARWLGCEIISADSRQFYKEMNIGTAKPTVAEQKGIRHHFIDFLSVHESYSAGHYERDGLACLERIFAVNPVAVLAGGSGLYVHALTNGFPPLPDTDKEIREDLNRIQADEGMNPLLERLRELDPEYYCQVDKKNSRRVIRALEACMVTGRKFSELRAVTPAKRTFRTIKIGLKIPKKELELRIRKRINRMLADGLTDEAKALLPVRHLKPLQAVGYPELFEFFDGLVTFSQATTNIGRNTMKYGVKQMTWFKRDREIHWFDPADEKNAAVLIKTILSL